MYRYRWWKAAEIQMQIPVAVTSKYMSIEAQYSIWSGLARVSVKRALQGNRSWRVEAQWRRSERASRGNPSPIFAAEPHVCRLAIDPLWRSQFSRVDFMQLGLPRQRLKRTSIPEAS